MAGGQPHPKKRKTATSVQPTMTSWFVSKVPKKSRPPQIFCDLDGVLVDFERGVQELTGAQPNNFMWPKINSTSGFYSSLPWMPDGEELWEAIRPLRPHILTGVPRGNSSASCDKFLWCKRELLVEVQWRDMTGLPMKDHKRVARDVKKYPTRDEDNGCLDTAVCTIITCWSTNKHLECRPGDILIDDRPEKLRDEWERMQGVFIHHVSTEQTLRELRELGILPSQTDSSTVENVAIATPEPCSPPEPCATSETAIVPIPCATLGTATVPMPCATSETATVPDTNAVSETETATVPDTSAVSETSVAPETNATLGTNSATEPATVPISCVTTETATVPDTSAVSETSVAPETNATLGTN